MRMVPRYAQRHAQRAAYAIFTPAPYHMLPPGFATLLRFMRHGAMIFSMPCYAFLRCAIRCCLDGAAMLRPVALRDMRYTRDDTARHDDALLAICRHECRYALLMPCRAMPRRR